MAAALATAADVQVKWRPGGPDLTAGESAYVNVLIGEASAKLRRRVTGLDELIAQGAVDSVLVVAVVTDAVLRVLRNPAGVSQQSIGSSAASFAGIRAVGQVVITDEDVAQILPVDAGDVGVAVGTFRFAVGSWRPPVQRGGW